MSRRVPLCAIVPLAAGVLAAYVQLPAGCDRSDYTYIRVGDSDRP